MILRAIRMWYSSEMPVVVIVVVAVVAFVAVNAATLVLLGSTRARREDLFGGREPSARRLRMKMH